MTATYEEELSKIDRLEKIINIVVEGVTHFDTKEICIAAIMESSYSILMTMNRQLSISKNDVNYLMGYIMPLLETISEDKGEYDSKLFLNSLSKNMHEYYSAYIKDIRLSIDIKEANSTGRH